MGNHTVGVIVLNEFMKRTDVAAVFAHPDDADDGVLYLSVKETAKKNNIPLFQFGGKRNDELERKIREISPDLIIIADYRYLLKSEVIGIPGRGAINFHPSLLPKYRGRAPVNWAIINGEKKCGLTVHYVDDGMDTGDIILQEEVEILFEDTIKDIHDKLFLVYADLAKRTIDLLEHGDPPRYRQNHSEATEFPRRRPEDGLIHWESATLDIYNLVRAVTHPYPGAFSFIEGEKYFIWQCKPFGGHLPAAPETVPGEICYRDKGGIGVRSGDGVVYIPKTQREGSPAVIDFASLPFSIGQKFISCRHAS